MPPLFHDENASTSVACVGQKEGTVQTGNDLRERYFRRAGPAGNGAQPQHDRNGKPLHHISAPEPGV